MYLNYNLWDKGFPWGHCQGEQGLDNMSSKGCRNHVLDNTSFCHGHPVSICLIGWPSNRWLLRTRNVANINGELSYTFYSMSVA